MDNKVIFVLLVGICLTGKVASAPSGSGNSCTDSGVWIAGGLLSCDDLKRPDSASGIGKDPQTRKKFCDSYWNECCSTCSSLFSDAPKTVVSSTPSPAPTTTAPLPGSSSCKDTNPLVAGGVVPCSDLLTPGSASGIDKNQKGFCDQHWDACCSTCTLLFPDEANGHYTVIVTKAPTPSPVSTDSQSGTCRDTNPMIADGQVPCSDLTKPNSATGIDQNPPQFCEKYWNECCSTCSSLYPNGLPPKAVTTKGTPSTTTDSVTSLQELLKESKRMLEDFSNMLKNMFGLGTKSHYTLVISEKKW